MTNNNNNNNNKNKNTMENIGMKKRMKKKRDERKKGSLYIPVKLPTYPSLRQHFALSQM